MESQAHFAVSYETIPRIGDMFPDLTVHTTHGKLQLPVAYEGKWFVLFSHPADFTPVCTTEFVSFARRQEQFEEHDCRLVGLSADQVFSHIKWVEWIKEKLGVAIRFPIIADETGDIASQLGMVHHGTGPNAVRGVIIVDPQGVIRLQLYYPQEIGRSIDEIIRAITALQIADKNGVITPSGWPHNELIGDNVIIPPALDIEAAHEHSRHYKCFDWWFCYRPV